jgi:hypothetical protein
MGALVSAAASVLALTLISTATQAATQTVAFPAAGDPYVSLAGGSGVLGSGGETGFMYNAGDYVEGSFTPTIPSVDDVTISVPIENYLGDGSSEQVELTINGVDVGSFTATDDGYGGDTQVLGFSTSFAPIPLGPTDVLQLVLQDTVPPGGGSIAFYDGGSAILVGGAVPEPAAWSLLIIGLGGVGWSLRGRQAAACEPV